MTEIAPIAAPPPATDRELRDRWLGVGRSSLPDSGEAGSAAAAEALAGRAAALLIVFSSDSYDPEPLLAGVISQAPEDTPLIGCSTAGEITAEGSGDGTVVVVALGGSGISAHTAAGADASSGLRCAGANAAACVNALDERPNRVLILLSDGRAGDQAEVIRGVHQVVGSGVPLAGGCAGDEMRGEGTFQFRDGQVLRDSVVGAAISSDGPIGLGWSHGWEPVGEPVLITRSVGNRVCEIDDRPALDSYLEHLDAPAEARSDPAAFTDWARLRPLGLGRRRTGQQPARCVIDADFEERSLICTAEVPQGGLAWFMRGDAVSVLESTRNACGQAVEATGADGPVGLLAFNCIGRRGILRADGIREEAALLAECSGAPFAGLFTLGEFARTTGVNAIHSQTLVALAFG